jgi:hypothetical protein
VLRGIGHLTLTTAFEKKHFGDATLYIDPTFSTKEKADTTHIYPDPNGYLIKNGKDFSLLTGQFSYNETKRLLYEGRNLQTSTGSRLSYGDLYLNGEFAMTDFPVQYKDADGGNTLSFNYLPKQNAIEAQRQDGEGCGSFYQAQGYEISSQEQYLEVSILNHRSNNDPQEGVKLFYQNKKLEVWPVRETEENQQYASLKYRYSVKETVKRKEQWRTIVEDFIVKHQALPKDTKATCEIATFSYAFDLEKKKLIIKRDANVGNKSETYTRSLYQIPVYYKTRP